MTPEHAPVLAAPAWTAVLTDLAGATVHARTFRSKRAALRWAEFIMPKDDRLTVTIAPYWLFDVPAFDAALEHEITSCNLDRM